MGEKREKDRVPHSHTKPVILPPAGSVTWPDFSSRRTEQRDPATDHTTQVRISRFSLDRSRYRRDTCVLNSKQLRSKSCIFSVLSPFFPLFRFLFCSVYENATSVDNSDDECDKVLLLMRVQCNSYEGIPLRRLQCYLFTKDLVRLFVHLVHI